VKDEEWLIIKPKRIEKEKVIIKRDFTILLFL
jgi:hypothetical protein